ncbi:MAG: hypothetical protein A3J24_00720 [Deltaproteobacteria bacterium RIFCSPLOWO2_02_FULL_53_8]|nr:MAG: hypothetical protein A3J24_00720 [Deltaproteobacteria bacterium RIFCSPLOWO2_02_FULL_53_8]
MLLSAIVAITMLAWLLIHIQNGFDFTDDAFYLVWISNPWIYKFSSTQFGFIYHPLYKLLDGDLALLRQANALITVGLAWLVFAVLLKYSPVEDKNLKANAWYGIKILIFSFSASVICLVFFNFWLPTPNYNSLALQALLIAATGLIIANKNSSPSSLIGWTLIGIAGWLAFMAKPPTAAALAFIAGGYLLLAKKMNIRMLAISLGVAIGLGLLSAWQIDNSISGFARRLMAGAEAAGMLTSAYNLTGMFRLDSFTWSDGEKALFLVGTFLTFISTCLMASSKQHAGIALLLALTLAGAAIIFVAPYTTHSHFEALLLWSGPLGGLLALFFLCRKNVFALFAKSSFLLPACFGSFPFVYAFGTGNNYWLAAGLAGVFWVLASFSFVGGADISLNKWKILLPILLTSQVTAALILFFGMEHPYRQTQAVRLQSNRVEINHSGNTILVSPDFASYITNLQYFLASQGFKRGDPMIDLTGHYPGSLYAVGAKSIGQPWMLGGYPGSEAYAVGALAQISCSEIANAWILTEPNGPRHLRPELLNKLGVDFDRNYAPAGDLPSPMGSYKRRFVQRIFKPVNTSGVAEVTCQIFRSTV